MTTQRLVIPEKDEREHLAFLHVGHARLKAGARLLADSLVIVPDSDLHCHSHALGLSLRPGKLVDIMNDARRAGRYLVEIHSHPFAGRRVQFSRTDLDGQAELYEHLVDVYGPVPYGALVMGSESVDGLFWHGGKPVPIDEIVVTGGVITTVSTTSGKPAPNPSIHLRHERQVLALGEAGQRLLARARVAVVGVGGTGSLVVQQLAYLGVGAMTIVDPDFVEETNLNRLAGATPDDVGRSKVEVLGDLAKRINRSLDLTKIAAELREREALSAVTECDFLIGCVDSDSGRLIMNELALAYCIPYIDVGVGIEAKDGQIEEAGGRVVVWLPNRPCLLCAREIDTRVAAEELEDEQQREFRRRHGYVAGQNMPSPSVISLNGAVASLAVTAFLSLVTGATVPPFYTYYDFLAQRVGHRLVSKDPRCVTCSIHASGDRAQIERYSRIGLPGAVTEIRSTANQSYSGRSSDQPEASQ